MVRTCRTEGQSRSGALASPATALDAWHTEHTPTILGFDEQIGALLIQAIEPATPPAVSWVYPTADGIAELLNGLHDADTTHRFHPSVGQRVAYPFDSSAKLHQRHRHRAALVPPRLDERGCRGPGDPDLVQDGGEPGPSRHLIKIDDNALSSAREKIGRTGSLTRS